MKKLITILLALVIIQGAFAKDKNDIVIFFTNDVHCGIENNICYAGVVAYRNEALKHTPYVTLVDAGDAVQGDLAGAVSKGEDIIEILNFMNYDVAVPGNHEFDYGMDQFKTLAGRMKCGYVCANFHTLPDHKLVFPPYKIIKYGKKKIAYVGVATPESVTKTAAVTFQDGRGNFIYSFGGEDKGKNMFADVQAAIDQARKKDKADYVILVAHLGEHEVTEEWNAMNLVANIQGADILIDGHSHEVTPSLKAKDKSGKEIVITQTGTKLSHLGKITITPDGKITNELIENAPADLDSKTQEFVEKIKKDYEGILSRQVGYLDFPLVATDKNNDWLVRSRETNLGDFLADSFKTCYKADIGLINGGGIRATIPAGELRYGDVFKTSPFGNMMCVALIPGQTILDELEFGVRGLPDNSGGFLQVSGLTFTVDTSIPSSVQMDDNHLFTGVKGPYRVKDVKVNGVPLELKKKYKVASTRFVIKDQGDGHQFDDIEIIILDDTFDRDVCAKYIDKLGGKIPAQYADPAGQGRIKIK